MKNKIRNCYLDGSICIDGGRVFTIKHFSHNPFGPERNRAKRRFVLCMLTKKVGYSKRTKS